MITANQQLHPELFFPVILESHELIMNTAQPQPSSGLTEIAPTGQFLAQALHSIHAPLSVITALLPLS